MSDQSIRLGIIGAGIMGERMLRAALDPDAGPAGGGPVTICATWDRDAAALDRVAGLGAPRADSAAAVIAASDCVYVATPPATHLSYAAEAIAAGKAVFLEKPLATDVEEAATFVRRHAAERVAVNFPFASSFAVDRLRAWLDEGAVGAPKRAAITVAFARWPRPWQEAASGWLDAPAEGGFTREVVSHFLFLSRRVLGPLALQSASVRRGQTGGTERGINVGLEAGGLPVLLRGEVGGTEVDDHNTWTLEGTGAVRLRDWSFAERQRPDGSWAADPDARPNAAMRPLVLRRQLEQVAALTRGAAHRLATLEEAWEVQAIVEAILRAPPSPPAPQHAPDA